MGPLIDGGRLWQSLLDMARVGATAAGGVRRLALTDEDRAGRDLFVAWCRQANCEVRIDRIGNIFARRAGASAAAPAVMIGSHLDTQPTGGRFDGVYGVLAGLEVVRACNDGDIRTQAPIEIAVWTSEEGARFAPAMIGSGVFSGVLDLQHMLDVRDAAGARLGDELQRIGYAGTHHAGEPRPAAHLELHIEQGPILEAARKGIGVVSGVLGIQWFDVLIRGEATHAGPMPMAMRRDPVRTAGALLNRLYELADAHGPDARVTIGRLTAEPGSRNTVPDTVRLTVDIRHPEEHELDAMAEAIRQIAASLSSSGGVAVGVTDLWKLPPVHFDERCVTAVRAAVAELGLSHQSIVSGAGHDSVYLSYVVPTAMIFIPCLGGLSHNEAESASPSDVEAGANVLLRAGLALAGVV